MDKIMFFDVGITNASKEDVLKYIFKTIREKDEKYYIVTPNPEIIMYARKHPEFKKILNESRLAIADGIGVVVGARLLGNRIKARLTGTDLMEDICKEASKQAVTVGFLGGKDIIAETAAKCLLKKYPSLKIVYISNGNPERNTVEMMKKTLEKGVKAFRDDAVSDIKTISMTQLDEKNKDKVFFDIDILFVAFGFPKQEEWMHQYIKELPVKIALGVGGAFDYYSGNVSRAPLQIRQIGLEWLYRLIRQPWRIPRQLALIGFILLLIKEKMRKKIN